MATAHLSIKVGKVGKATPHSEYIIREGKYTERLKQGEKLEACESGNMPKWAENDPIQFWKAADQYERKNGYVYREHEIALPRELTASQRVDLVREWVSQELGNNHAYTWAIHNKTALDGGEQPHVHLMFSERINDGIERDPDQYFKRYNPKYPERGGARKHNVQGTYQERKEVLKAQRDRWEKLHNEHLTKYGHHANISMKSLKVQGINRIVEPKMTPSESAALQRKAQTERLAKATIAIIKRERLEQRQQILAQQPILDLFKQLKTIKAKTKLDEVKALMTKKPEVLMNILECKKLQKELDSRKQKDKELKLKLNELNNQGILKRLFNGSQKDEITQKIYSNQKEYGKLKGQFEAAKLNSTNVLEQAINNYLKPFQEEHEQVTKAMFAHPLEEFETMLSEREKLLTGQSKKAYEHAYSQLYSHVMSDVKNRNEKGEKLHRCMVIDFVDSSNLVGKSQEHNQHDLNQRRKITIERVDDVDRDYDYEIDM